MEKIIVCGTENINGALCHAPLDEKNVTTDWMQDFLFDGNCAKATWGDMLAGFALLGSGEYLCSAYNSGNFVMYEFPDCCYLSKRDLEDFCNKVASFFEDNEFTIKVSAKDLTNEQDGYEPQITITFYHREEE